MGFKVGYGTTSDVELLDLFSIEIWTDISLADISIASALQPLREGIHACSTFSMSVIR